MRSRSTRALDEPAFNPPGSLLWFYGTATNDPEHAHRLAACWNAFSIAMWSLINLNPCHHAIHHIFART